MKSINWVRVVIYVIVVLILIRMFASVYMSGFFHPKEVVMNDIKITAPKNYYLIGINSSNGKYHFDLFSPLKLNFGSKYILDDNQSIEITFSDMKGGIESIYASKKNRVWFKKMLLTWTKDKDSSVSLFREKNGQCPTIYRILNKSEKNPFWHLFFFDEAYKIEFSVLAVDKEDAQRTMNKICSQKSDTK
jgi:hypothetical protein